MADVSNLSVADLQRAMARIILEPAPGHPNMDGPQHVIVDSIPSSSTDTRGLTERMFAKAPATGKTLWLDIDSSSTGFIYIAEAVAGSNPASAAVWQGIRVQQDANGNPLGAVQTATGFAWNARATATWVS